MVIDDAAHQVSMVIDAAHEASSPHVHPLNKQHLSVTRTFAAKC
jgi:hypothetical protein